MGDFKITKIRTRYHGQLHVANIEPEERGAVHLCEVYGSNRAQLENRAALLLNAEHMREVLQNLVNRNLIRDIEGDHYSEIIELLEYTKGKV